MYSLFISGPAYTLWERAINDLIYFNENNYNQHCSSMVYGSIQYVFVSCVVAGTIVSLISRSVKRVNEETEVDTSKASC